MKRVLLRQQSKEHKECKEYYLPEQATYLQKDHGQ